MSETLWRCESCGKWSHAKRRPASHDRNIRCESYDEEAPPRVIEELTETEADTGALSLWGWRVACGPFAEYVAAAVSS